MGLCETLKRISVHRLGLWRFTVTLLDVLRLLRRSWLILVVCTLLGVAAMAGFTALQPTIYSATSTGYLVAGQATGNVFDAQNNQTFAAQRAQQYVPLANTSAVQERMAAHLEDSATGTTPGAISVYIVDGSNMMQVSAQGNTPEQAQERANAGVQAMADVIHRLETVNPGQAIQAAGEGEMGSLEQLESNGQSAIALVSLEPAVAPINPVSPNWPRNLLMGALGGLGLGGVIALGRRMLDARVRTKEDVEKLTTASVLAVIPENTDLKRDSKERAKGKPIANSSLAFEAL